MQPLTARPEVNLVQAFGLFFRRFFDYRGRSSRSEFVWVAATHVAITLTVTVLSIARVLAEGLGLTGSTPGDNSPIYNLYSLVMLVGMVSLTVRRLRDAGFSPYLTFLICIPGAGAIALLVMGSQPSKQLVIDGVPAVAALSAGDQHLTISGIQNQTDPNLAVGYQPPTTGPSYPPAPPKY
ncbi:DUF805 domain-containing protein [Micrococcales bacterium 31B]|nr:DUF805 domain-containing protein [Micrococcales bacterium 31B]